MTPLLDVNILLAYGWKAHPDHIACKNWLNSTSSFATCPISELGFIRISMGPAFRASYDDSLKTLKNITSKPGAECIPCDIPVTTMPAVTSYKNTTDSYLVALAQQHAFRLATLDQRLVIAEWSDGVAFNPLAART